MDRVPSLEQPVPLATLDILLDVFPKNATYDLWYLALLECTAFVMSLTH